MAPPAKRSRTDEDGNARAGPSRELPEYMSDSWGWDSLDDERVAQRRTPGSSSRPRTGPQLEVAERSLADDARPSAALDRATPATDDDGDVVMLDPAAMNTKGHPDAPAGDQHQDEGSGKNQETESSSARQLDKDVAFARILAVIPDCDPGFARETLEAQWEEFGADQIVDAAVQLIIDRPEGYPKIERTKEDKLPEAADPGAEPVTIGTNCYRPDTTVPKCKHYKADASRLLQKEMREVPHSL